jgi:hypothetical protein
MLRHAFTFVSRVIFLIGRDNLRSQRAIEKIGGVCVGTRLDGSARSSLVYLITPSPGSFGGESSVTSPPGVTKDG